MGSEPAPYLPAAVPKTQLNINPCIGPRRHTCTRHFIDFNLTRLSSFRKKNPPPIAVQSKVPRENDQVRSKERGALGFLSDYRRLNVAITRARKGLVVGADRCFLLGILELACKFQFANNSHVNSNQRRNRRI